MQVLFMQYLFDFYNNLLPSARKTDSLQSIECPSLLERGENPIVNGCGAWYTNILAKIQESMDAKAEREARRDAGEYSRGRGCVRPGGHDFLARRLPELKKERNIRFTVINGENANVVGVTPKQAERIFAAGADVITLGNHTWTRWEMQPYLREKPRILRPANYAPSARAGAWGSMTRTSARWR